MPWEIAKQFQFSASHHLPHLPPEHPCSRLHGHNYTVEVILGAELPNRGSGFILDYRDLEPFKRWLDQNLDHRDLNEIFNILAPGLPTTAEFIALVLFDFIRSTWPAWPLRAVRVSETAKTWAEYRGA